ncbi:hypothetical protein ACLOJK_040100 [Asimina triloba]
MPISDSPVRPSVRPFRFRFSLRLALPYPASFSSSSASPSFPAIFSPASPPPMSALLARAFTLRSKPPPVAAVYSLYLHSLAFSSPCSPILHRRIHVSSPSPTHPRLLPGIFACQRGFRKTRRKPVAAKKKAAKEKQLELNVAICIEEEMPDDPEVLNIAEMLRLNVPMAMKIAFDGLKDSDYKTRDASIDDVGKFDKVELSVLLCNDDFIRKLNKEWRDEDHATDVLSMSQHIPQLELPILMLGDVVISVETAARQAKERGHTLLDEIRILMIHGLLHLLGFDHEISDEAEEEMEKEEELILKSLGWKGKGLIQSANDAVTDGSPQIESINGTLLNSKSLITSRNAEALKEAISRGIRVVIATGKARDIDLFHFINPVSMEFVISVLAVLSVPYLAVNF